VLAGGSLMGCGAGSEDEDTEAARRAVDAWVKAVNARDWDRACALDSYPGRDCSLRIERAFGSSAGRIRVTGRNPSNDSLLYGIKTPTGSGEISAGRTGDRWRVHPEITVIR